MEGSTSDLSWADVIHLVRILKVIRPALKKTGRFLFNILELLAFVTEPVVLAGLLAVNLVQG